MTLEDTMLLQEIYDKIDSILKRLDIIESIVHIPQTKESLVCPKCGVPQMIEYNTYHITNGGTIKHKDKLCNNCKYQIIAIKE